MRERNVEERTGYAGLKNKNAGRAPFKRARLRKNEREGGAEKTGSNRRVGQKTKQQGGPGRTASRMPLSSKGDTGSETNGRKKTAVKQREKKGKGKGKIRGTTEGGTSLGDNSGRGRVTGAAHEKWAKEGQAATNILGESTKRFDKRNGGDVPHGAQNRELERSGGGEKR